MIALDRRRFLQMAGSASLLSAAGGRLGWAEPRSATRFAYVGTASAIHVYSVSPARWVELQTIPVAHPVVIAIANGKLYVANGVSRFENLPRGSVEAYGIDQLTGRLERINQVPLSLSGTQPRDLAIAPDGRSLVVAIHGGGAYNVVSIDEGGRLGRVTGILKEIGSGPHPLQASAHPSAIIFDRQGHVLTADMGADKLSVLALVNGELCVSSRCDVTAGSGPACMVLHPDGRRVYVAHALDGSLSRFAYEPAGGLKHKQTVQASVNAEAAALAMHPSGEVLYSSHGRALQTWKIDAAGDLEALHRIDSLPSHALRIAADGRSLFALSAGAVLKMKLDEATRAPFAPMQVASLA
ncbi:MAG: beta-propeller fold lactonase family protein, partial [Acidobacteriaceae bacterium]